MDVTDPAELQTVINLGKTPGETKTMIESVTNKPYVCCSLAISGIADFRMEGKVLGMIRGLVDLSR
jgi:hypothetical protein